MKDFETGEWKEDPSLSTWQVQIRENGHLTHTIPTHLCTPHDWKQFHTPSQRSTQLFHSLSQKNHTMRCVNNTDVEGLYGEDTLGVHRHMEIVFKACERENLTSENKH
jgi:hypothetical protein